tara:strand:- start:65 stop:220 length:156 start_codon:yes stop_codon:yes gene_type:complete
MTNSIVILTLFLLTVSGIIFWVILLVWAFESLWNKFLEMLAEKIIKRNRRK